MTGKQVDLVETVVGRGQLFNGDASVGEVDYVIDRWQAFDVGANGARVLGPTEWVCRLSTHALDPGDRPPDGTNLTLVLSDGRSICGVLEGGRLLLTKLLT